MFLPGGCIILNQMPTIVQGELVRHQNQPFYSQQKTPKFFWAGCLIPLAVVAVVGYLVLHGASTSAGTNVIRGFILLIVAIVVIQILAGAGLFFKKRSSLALGLMVGGATIFVLLMLALIALASILGSFLQ